jgi:hypothetical protein
MGTQVRRPLHEGVGTKPTTEKPSLEHNQFIGVGLKPTSSKPEGHPGKSKAIEIFPTTRITGVTGSE